MVKRMRMRPEMPSLAEYQQGVLAALSPTSAESSLRAVPTPDDPAVPIVAGAIVERAQRELASVCPVVTGLLSFDDRLAAEVLVQLRRRARPVSIYAWGTDFASRLSCDPDPWISWAAQVDAAMIAAADARRMVDPVCPGDPMRAVLLIASGSDPRSA